MRKSATPRILSRVGNLGGDGCWTWEGGLHKGYGTALDETGRSTKVHRIVYRWLVGPIPEGLTLDHLCRNRACVRPSHLEPVTVRENILRGVGPTAREARKTHCKWGHEFSAENTRWDKLGRRCGICHTRRGAERNERLRGKRPSRARTTEVER